MPIFGYIFMLSKICKTSSNIQKQVIFVFSVSNLSAPGIYWDNRNKISQEDKRAEIIIAAQIAKEDFSLKKSEVFVDNSKHIFPDSKIAQAVNCYRKKATCIIKNILSVVFLASLIAILKLAPFSLLADEILRLNA